MQRNIAQQGLRITAGFTLVELVLVMLIIGIVSAIAMPRFAQAGARQRLEVASERVLADLALVRSRANSASDTAMLSFDRPGSFYKASAVGGAAFVVALNESPYEVKIDVADFNNLTYVQFNAYGIAQSTGTIVLSNAAGTVTIDVTEYGEARR